MPVSPDAYDPYALPADAVREPPTTWAGALREIGPGMILTGMIVGSGELILTTSLGARFGYVFLWLILYSCVVKVFIQIELGRFAIASGRPTLGALDALGGLRWGANWLVWWWLLMMLCTVAQLGAMTGGTGQALQMVAPLPVANGLRPESLWACVCCLVAVVLLLSGGYRRIESLTTWLVASVTFLTVLAVAALAWSPYPLHLPKLWEGLWPQLPHDTAGLREAFGVFGITGVGATELYAYPYWCLEKGYARFAGRDDGSEAWLRRARGWIRVMQIDAWCSMVVFTVSTVAFYLMGAAVLHPQELVPEKSEMIRTLSQMYMGPFGAWTQAVFLCGAGCVLFKTLYVASASHSRLTADFLSLGGFAKITSAEGRTLWIRRFCLFYPLLALALFFVFKEPKAMVVFGGIAQAMTLPIISVCAIWFRYRQLDRRLQPSIFTDGWVWLATISITVVALYAAWMRLSEIPELLKGV